MTHSLALPYSKALFQLFSSKEELLNVLHLMENFLHFLQDNPLLKQFFLHPFIEKKEKKTILKKIWEPKFSSSISPFFSLLIDKKRFDLLEEIVCRYRQMVDRELEVVRAEVTVAVPLDEESKEKLKNKLESFYQKKVTISLKIDPQMLGGMIVIVDDQILDKSVKNQLKQLERALQREIWH